MALNSLFDKDRVNAVRGAVEKDKPLPGLKAAKPLAEPGCGLGNPVPELEYHLTMVKIVQAGGLIPRYDPHQDLDIFKANCDLYSAISAGDSGKAADAISRGADIHSKAGYVPPAKLGQRFISQPMTPLQYAMEIGQVEMADLLRQHGAKA